MGQLEIVVTINTYRRYFQHVHFIPTVGVWERETHIKKAALVRNYFEVYWPCAGGLSAMNAIGTQLRDPITLD